MSKAKSKMGHNTKGPDTGSIASAELRAFIERIERLEEEKAGLQADIREVYAEAKGRGYENKIMRMVIRLRKMEDHDRMEQDALLATYLHAVGFDDTPLGEWAEENGFSVSITHADGTQSTFGKSKSDGEADT